MTGIADRIMKRTLEHKTGWVFTPNDFADIGSRAAVDQALSRLVKTGRLRRVNRGLYDVPRYSDMLKRIAAVDLHAAVAAIVRRDGTKIMSSGSVYANQLGLTNMVPAKPVYDTDGYSRTVKISRTTVQFRHAPPNIMRWAGKPGGPVIQALRWLGPYASKGPDVIPILRHILPDYVKLDLSRNIRYAPTWMRLIISNVTSDEAIES